jgi:hypothetical protein
MMPLLPKFEEHFLYDITGVIVGFGELLRKGVQPAFMFFEQLCKKLFQGMVLSPFIDM